jgi:acetylglutamate kinase
MREMSKPMASSLQSRLDLLREALPYIQRFKGKTFVVKLSGKATEDALNLDSLAEELALIHGVGIRVCVVHGGGKQLNDLALRMGVEQTVINGRRVTNDATLDMAKMIFAGKINTDILAALRRRGALAVGLSGIDGAMVQATRRPEQEILNRATGARERVDFGHVGDVVEVDTRLLCVLMDQGYLPVVSSLAADAEGKVFNINADTIATEVSVRLEAEKLILLSDVDGLFLRPGEMETKLSRLASAEVEALIRDGVATGGMIPKLQNIVELLRRGVKSAHIINGNTRNTLLSEVFTDEGTGTMIIA